MSMLAERKRKIVYSVNPNGNSWSEDGNGFGRKMLEKFGWSQGKGLGPKLGGSPSHIKLQCNSSHSGMGYLDQSDKWRDHDDQFNALLHSLQSDCDIPTNEGNSGASNSLVDGVQSLEMKSKSSRARVHYKKFTRGKDLALYSEKDLASIFGRKSLDIPAKRVLEIVDNEQAPKTTEDTALFMHSGSMADYFKQKMAGLRGNRVEPQVAPEDHGYVQPTSSSSKRKRDVEIEENQSQGHANPVSDDKMGDGRQKKVKKSIAGVDNPSFCDAIEGEASATPSLDEQSNCDSELSKKEKKRRRNAQRALKQIENSEMPYISQLPDAATDENATNLCDSDASSKCKKKKSKKSKSGLENPVFQDSPLDGAKMTAAAIESNPFEVVLAEKSKKKKKKSGSSLEKQSKHAQISEKCKLSALSIEGADNPAFNPSTLDAESSEEEMPARNLSSSKIASASKQEMAHVEALVTPPPASHSFGITEDIMMNVSVLTTPSDAACGRKSILQTPQSAQKNGARRKSVRIDESRNQQRIIPHRLEGASMAEDDEHADGGGIGNPAFSSAQEDVANAAMSFDACQAEVDNDINESKQRRQADGGAVMVLPSVGLVGDQSVDEDCQLADGSVQLSYRNAKFLQKREMAYPEHSTSVAKKAYRHLIKGDIVLEFNNCNLHEIAGYGNTPRRKTVGVEKQNGEEGVGVTKAKKKKHARKGECGPRGTKLEGVAKTMMMLQQQQQ